MGQNQPKFDPKKFQSNLAMAQTRLNLHKNKRTNSIYGKKQEIAMLLREGKEELARIKVEGLINDENFIQAIDIIQLYCAQLKERHRIICEQPKPPVDMMKALHTVFYAAPRAECQELEVVREQLYGKYGKEFALAARDNTEGLVDLVVVAKLEATTPEQELKTVKLREIAVEFHVEYTPADEMLNMLAPNADVPSVPGGHMGSFDMQMPGMAPGPTAPPMIPQGNMMPSAPRISHMDPYGQPMDPNMGGYPNMNINQLQPMGAYVPAAHNMQPGMMPMQPGMMPQQPGMMPQQPGMMPQQPGMMPQQPGMMPQEPQIHPEQPGMMPPQQPGMPPNQHQPYVPAPPAITANIPMQGPPAPPGPPQAPPADPVAAPGSGDPELDALRSRLNNLK